MQSARSHAVRKGQGASGLAGVYAGLPIAMAAQVPYTATLLTSFEFFNRMIVDEDAVNFHRYDDYNFLYKFLLRFGASTLSVALATSLWYPLDTLKRMY